MKKFKTIVTVLLALLFLSSCASTTRVHSLVGSTPTPIVTPKVGEEARVNINEVVLNQGLYSTTKTVVLKSGKGVSTPKGEYLLVGKSNRGEAVYRNSEKPFLSSTYPTLLEKYKGQITLATGRKKPLKAKDFDITYTVGESSFNQRLLLKSIKDNIVTLSYKESIPNSSERIKSVDLSFDLSKNKTININNSSIEVLSFDESSITYKVISGF